MFRTAGRARLIRKACQIDFLIGMAIVLAVGWWLYAPVAGADPISTGHHWQVGGDPHWIGVGQVQHAPSRFNMFLAELGWEWPILGTLDSTGRAVAQRGAEDAAAALQDICGFVVTPTPPPAGGRGGSAALVGALAAVDRLLEGQISQGRRIAATGAVNAKGFVLPVGAIEDKMQAAMDADADLVLVPLYNAAEAEAHLGGRIPVMAIISIQDALNTLSPGTCP